MIQIRFFFRKKKDMSFYYFSFLWFIFLEFGLFFFSDNDFRKKQFLRKDCKDVTFWLIIITNMLIVYGSIKIYDVQFLGFQYDVKYWTLIPAFLWSEIWFYAFHRLLHLEYFYKKIHSLHHRHVYPISFSALYAHPIENIVVNVGMVISSVYLFEMCFEIYFLMIILSAVTSHCGEMNFYFFKYKSPHDNHHIYFNCEYGTGLFMDKIFKTEFLLK